MCSLVLPSFQKATKRTLAVESPFNPQHPVTPGLCVVGAGATAVAEASRSGSAGAEVAEASRSCSAGDEVSAASRFGSAGDEVGAASRSGSTGAEVAEALRSGAAGAEVGEASRCGSAGAEVAETSCPDSAGADVAEVSCSGSAGPGNTLQVTGFARGENEKLPAPLIFCNSFLSKHSGLPRRPTTGRAASASTCSAQNGGSAWEKTFLNHRLRVDQASISQALRIARQPRVQLILVTASQHKLI